MNVVAACWFKNDADRKLVERARHLLSKTYGRLRWLWLVGDSTDSTLSVLADVARQSGKNVTVKVYDTNIEGSDPATRLRRLSMMLSTALDLVQQEDDFFLLHESDLRTPDDLVERLLATGKSVTAGWPVLGDMFYDTLAYYRNGRHFTNYPPYHACYRPDEIFEVDGAGSVLMFPAAAAQLVKPESLAVIEVCQKLRSLGHSIWVDPHIKVVQPSDLWHAEIPLPFELK